LKPETSNSEQFQTKVQKIHLTKNVLSKSVSNA